MAGWETANGVSMTRQHQHSRGKRVVVVSAEVDAGDVLENLALFVARVGKKQRGVNRAKIVMAKVHEEITAQVNECVVRRHSFHFKEIFKACINIITKHTICYFLFFLIQN